MYSDNTETESEKNCKKLFDILFRDSREFYKKLTPLGWENSEFKFLFHPTPEQRFEEYRRISQNLNGLFKKKKNRKIEKQKTIRDFIKECKKDMIENPWKEFIEIFGYCLWDIFSNNHEVISPSKKVFDIGSFRGAAGFIADYINDNYPVEKSKYDYMDFYMGSIWISERASLEKFYLHIFNILKQQKCNWKYVLPQMYLIDFSKEKEEVPDPSVYDPQKAVLEEFKKGEEDKRIRELKDDIDKANEKMREKAKCEKPPLLVLCYKKIFGDFPDGHPQKRP